MLSLKKISTLQNLIRKTITRPISYTSVNSKSYFSRGDLAASQGTLPSGRAIPTKMSLSERIQTHQNKIQRQKLSEELNSTKSVRVKPEKGKYTFLKPKIDRKYDKHIKWGLKKMENELKVPTMVKTSIQDHNKQDSISSPSHSKSIQSVFNFKSSGCHQT